MNHHLGWLTAKSGPHASPSLATEVVTQSGQVFGVSHARSAVAPEGFSFDPALMDAIDDVRVGLEPALAGSRSG